MGQAVDDPINNKGQCLVIGLGNTLQSDDGLGIHAAQMLSSRALPAGVEVQALGTPGWGLVSFMQGWERVYVIDAVQMGEAPGTWRRFEWTSGQEELRLVTSQERLSLHEPGLADSLALGETLGILPQKIVIYGIEPLRIEPGETLSPPIKASLSELVDNLYNELWKGT